MKVFRTLIIVQATYILITAVCPIVHIESFTAVTGDKTDFVGKGGKSIVDSGPFD